MVREQNLRQAEDLAFKGFYSTPFVLFAEKAVHILVGPKLTTNQFNACVSLVFNIGAGNFRASQIRQRLLRDDHEGAADIWWQWRRGGPGRRILPALVRRREMEKELFLTDVGERSVALLNFRPLPFFTVF